MCWRRRTSTDLLGVDVRRSGHASHRAKVRPDSAFAPKKLPRALSKQSEMDLLRFNIFLRYTAGARDILQDLKKERTIGNRMVLHRCISRRKAA